MARPAARSLHLTPQSAPGTRAVLPAALTVVLTLLILLVGAATAQEPLVPERFANTLTDTDLPGGDYDTLVDVSVERCLSACLGDDDCAAFTFNQHHGVCFLKGTVGESVPFAGATSGVINRHDPETLSAAVAAAATMTFLNDYDLMSASEQGAKLARTYAAEGQSEAQLLGLSRRQSPAWAVTLTGGAVTVADSGPAWLAHALALLDLAAAEPNRAYLHNSEASSAALNAVLRLDGSMRAEALLVLAEALEASRRGEAALGAVRLANELVPGMALDTLARLREAFGFRMLAFDVDARTAAPRICVTFSEELDPEQDYDRFVQRNVSGLALEADGQQLCLTGVTYGERYRLTLRAGLPSEAGDSLVVDTPLDVYVRDRTPLVRFPGRTYVLPAKGPRALPVETVNANRLDLKLLRVADRNLVAAIREGTFLSSLGPWQARLFEENVAEKVWEGEAEVNGALNQTATSLLPLEEAVELEPGVYVLVASIPGVDEYDSPPAMQWFLISDLGVTTLSGADGVHVVVQSLATGEAVKGLKVSLVAHSNRLLGEATTDAEGHAQFPARLTRGPGNAAPALVLVESDSDMAVLSLEEPEFDLSDRGVEGRSATGPIDVYLTTDRGAYRPGETIHLTGLVRDERAEALSSVPLSVRLMRPDGVEYARRLAPDIGGGGHVVAFDLGANVPRGVWRVNAYLDPTEPPLATLTLLVEDFLPERIDPQVTLSGEGLIDPAAPPTLNVQARYLFGVPAAGVTLTGSASVEAVHELPDWPGYLFGRYDERVETQRRDLPAGLRTDDGGAVTVPLPLQRLELGHRPYLLTVNTTLLDGSSRPVERSVSRTLKPTSDLVGVRPSFSGPLTEGGEAAFDLVLVDPEGAPVEGTLTWHASKVETRYQWYTVNGSWHWEPVTERSRVAEGTVTVGDAPARLRVPVDWGRYEITVRQEGERAVTSVPFAAGWTTVDTTRDTPDLLFVSLDQATYQVGDTAKLRVVPEGPGVLLVTVLATGVIDTRLVEVTGETTLELPVTEAWGASAYVAASLLRSSDRTDRMPARSLGVAHAAVDPGSRLLNASIDAPIEIRALETLTVTLEVPELEDGTAYATVAAVDVGVLNITGFTAPAPADHYFGQRRLGVGVRDLYGRLIDARQGAMGIVRSGGGLEVDGTAGPPPAEDLVALFSGPVELVNGRAVVPFEVPPFSGTLRVMAVVWSDTAVGQASEDVLVRDPVVIQGSAPRFMTPGDVSRLRLELTHVSGAPGEMSLSVSGHGLASPPSRVELARGARMVIDIPLAPTELGEHNYTVELTTPDGETLKRELRLGVLHTDPRSVDARRLTLAPGESLTLDEGALTSYAPGTASAMLVSGLSSRLDLPGVLLRLTSYPYMCTEQVASRAWAYLIAREEMQELGIMRRSEAVTLLQEAVDFVLTRQDRVGSFGLWGVGGYDLWLDAYITDFLLQAEEAGASVPAEALRVALDNLSNNVARAGSMQDGAAKYAHAFYVLARAGEAVIGDLRYYADTYAESFDTPLAAAQLGAALAAYGERARAETLFEQAQALALKAGEQGWRADYGTRLRDVAGLLALASAADSAVVDEARLLGLLAEAKDPALMSPQEAAWLLRAGMALDAEAPGLEVDGSAVQGSLVLAYSGAPVQVRNVSDQEAILTLTTAGVPSEPVGALSRGYTITRTYFTTEGEPADLSSVKVGERLVAVIDVHPQAGVPRARLMVDSPLPAGFEIDNPNLLQSGGLGSFAWLTTAGYAEFTEARSDRFIAAVEAQPGDRLRLAYVVRAVSAGEFHGAAPLVEDLYRPTNRGLGETEWVRVTE